MKILTLAGEKGGIGKTTLAFHVACYLAAAGRRVLAMDLDPQGNLSYTLTGHPAPGIKRVIIQEWPLSAAITQNGDGYPQLLAGDKSTGSVRNYLAVHGASLTALVPLLERAAVEGFEFVIIDTPPSPAMDTDTGRVLDALTAPALYASHYVLSPCIPEQLPLAGLRSLSGTLRVLKEKGSKVELLGVVPTFFDARTTEHARNLQALVQVYGAQVYPVIGRATAVSHCPAYGQPIWEFDGRNPAAHQLRRMAQRILNDVEPETITAR